MSAAEVDGFDLDYLFKQREIAIQKMRESGKVVTEVFVKRKPVDEKIYVEKHIYRYGFNRAQIQEIFNAVNRWLPIRYQWIMSSLSEVSGGFGGSGGSGVLTGTDGMPMRGRFFEDMRESQRWASTPARYNIDVSSQVDMEDVKDVTRLKDALMLEARCMVDLKAECSVDCKIDWIPNDKNIPLYGCRDHGLIHVCVGNRSTCSFGHVNREKNIICVYSGREIDNMHISTKSYNIRKDPGYTSSFSAVEYGGSAMGDGDDYGNYGDYGGNDDYGSYGGTGYEGKECEEYGWDSVANDYENYDVSGSAATQRKMRREYKNGMLYAKITNTELNEAMVRSAVQSGKSCVVTHMAAKIIIDRFFDEDTRTRGSKSAVSRIRQREKNELVRKNILFQGGDINGVLLMGGQPQDTKGGTPANGVLAGRTNSSSRGTKMYVSGEYISDHKKKKSQENAVFSSDGSLSAYSTVTNCSRVSLGAEYSPDGISSPSGRTLANTERLRRCGEDEFSHHRQQEESWDTTRADETVYKVDSYKEELARKMTWESIRRGAKPTFLVEGTDEETMNIKQYLKEGGPDALSRASTLMSDTPYSVPLGTWTQGEGMVLSPANTIRLSSSPGAVGRLLGGILSSPSSGGSSPSSPSRSGLPNSSGLPAVGPLAMGRRKRDSPLSTIKRGYSLNADGTHAKRKRGRTSRLSSSSRGSSDGGRRNTEVKQYYLIEEEDANSTRTSKSRERLQRRKGSVSLSTVLLKSRVESSMMQESVKRALAISAPMVTGSAAEILMGKPSMETMRGIAMSSHTSYASDSDSGFGKDVESLPDRIIDRGGGSGGGTSEVETVKPNMLSISSGTGYRRITSRAYARSEGGSLERKGALETRKDDRPKLYVPSIDQNSLVFKQRYQRFIRWVEENTIVDTKDIRCYIETTKAIMNDLIFNSAKRESMRLAYGIASMVNTAEEVKRRMTKIERELRSVRNEEKQCVQELKRKYGKAFTEVHIPPTAYVRDYYKRNKKALGPSAVTFMSTIDRVTESKEGEEGEKENQDDWRAKLNFMDETEVRRYKYGKRKASTWNSPSLGNGVEIPVMTELDDIFAENMQTDYISVVPHNVEKQQKYSNEIVRLWVILLACENVHSMPSPKSQFDHFVLGVLYLLSASNIRIGGHIVMERDEWLKDVLPSQRRLCENYSNKLKRKDVAVVLRKETNLDERMLTFSTKSRSYTSKVVTKGCTRVKNWVNEYNGSTDMDALCVYLRKNSVVEYIHVSKTMGNIDRGRRRVYNRNKTSLFK